jgi:hypothetical protein
MFLGFFSIALVVQMFVLGPRLILGVREYHAKLVANSDEATGMASIVFQDVCLAELARLECRLRVVVY